MKIQREANTIYRRKNGEKIIMSPQQKECTALYDINSITFPASNNIFCHPNFKACLRQQVWHVFNVTLFKSN